MKIEADNNTLWIVLILSIALVLFSIIGGGYWFAVSKSRAAFQAGFQEVPDSSNSTHYGK